MPPASAQRRNGSSPLRHAPIPKDSRAARAARRDRVVLAEIELWRSVAGQTSTPSRRSSASSAGSFADENGSIAGSLATEDDTEETDGRTESVLDDDTMSQFSEVPSPLNPMRRPLRPAQQPTMRTLTLRPLPSRAASFAGFATPTLAPEIRSLEFDVLSLTLAENINVTAVRPPSTPRRRTRLRL
ncbi:hypothetical protein BDV93DRAFT_539841 [Ceratobasidium sp. AG-I]|nr:hypothetical protein BDV93DRAFT_539841 [Ceratobasidium sp. AG-I]